MEDKGASKNWKEVVGVLWKLEGCEGRVWTLAWPDLKILTALREEVRMGQWLLLNVQMTDEEAFPRVIDWRPVKPLLATRTSSGNVRINSTLAYRDLGPAGSRSARNGAIIEAWSVDFGKILVDINKFAITSNIVYDCVAEKRELNERHFWACVGIAGPSFDQQGILKHAPWTTNKDFTHNIIPYVELEMSKQQDGGKLQPSSTASNDFQDAKKQLPAAATDRTRGEVKFGTKMEKLKKCWSGDVLKKLTKINGFVDWLGENEADVHATVLKLYLTDS